MIELNIIDDKTDEIWTVVEIDDELEKQLNEVCKKTGKSIEAFIGDMFTDMMKEYANDPDKFMQEKIVVEKSS